LKLSDGFPAIIDRFTKNEQRMASSEKFLNTPPQRGVIFRVKSLCKSFGGQRVLDGVSLELNAGDVILLRGDNGSGKTTLLNILTGNLEPDAGTIELFTNHQQEHFRFPRPWWQELNPADHFTPERVAIEGVGRSWQDIRLFRTQTLCDNLSVATPNQKGENPFWAVARPLAIRRDENRNQRSSMALLSRLGLEGRDYSYADQVSLGQSKRVAIARAVNAGAKILFLDEPLAGLDAKGIEQVLTLLDDLVTTQQLTFVIVEHVFHIQRLLGLVTGVWTLRHGQVSISTPGELADEKAAIRDVHQWSRELAGPSESVDDISLANEAHLSIILPQGRKRGRVLLEVNDLEVNRGSRVVIGGDGRRLSFRLHEGELAVLQAPNGWGKTTLLQALSGLLPVHRGQILLDGLPIQSQPAWVRSRSGLSFLQSQNQIFPSLTVEETLQLAGIDGNGLNHLRRRRVADLSGGEKQRVALHGNCAPGKKCLLFDEPFSMLDQEGVRDVQEAVLQNPLTAVLIAIPGTHKRP
jgi:branched-chain amino acid transport system ATP-binding protein